MNGNIYIPEPCHENWHKMSPTEKGRHCEVCSKVVTDFSKMNREQIITTLSECKEELCGHIPLNHLTPTTERQKLYFWFKGTFLPKLSYVMFGVLGFAAIFKKSAYGQTVEGKVQVMMNGGAKYQAPTLESKKVNVVVVDEHNNPVSDAMVSIKINDAVVHSAVTDIKGECSNTVEIQTAGYSIIDIEVDAYGYKHKVVKQIRVSKNNTTYRVKLDDEVVIMGKFKTFHTPTFEPVVEPTEIPVKCTSEQEIQIDQPSVVLIDPNPDTIQIQEANVALMNDSTYTETFVPKFEWTNHALSFIAFPNPTMSDITIQTKEEITFDVRIFNENGVEILQLLNQNQRAEISLSGNAAGNYFAIISINNKAVETHKIILIR